MATLGYGDSWVWMDLKETNWCTLVYTFAIIYKITPHSTLSKDWSTYCSSKKRALCWSIINHHHSLWLFTPVHTCPEHRAPRPPWPPRYTLSHPRPGTRCGWSSQGFLYTWALRVQRAQETQKRGQRSMKKWMNRRTDTWHNGCLGKVDGRTVHTTPNHQDFLPKTYLQIILGAFKYVYQTAATTFAFSSVWFFYGNPYSRYSSTYTCWTL